MTTLPPKLIAAIDGVAMEYIAVGDSTPPIVLINDAGAPMESWYKVLPGLEALSGVFAYNRCGIGNSGNTREAQTSAAMMETLRALLFKAGLTPPYVLVAHALGSLIANLFARSYAGEVAAAVLLDAATPEDISALDARRGRLGQLMRRALDLAQDRDTLNETGHLRRSAEQIAEAPPFPDIPLCVISGGAPSLSWLTPRAVLDARAEGQRRLAALSPRGRHVIAARSSHFPQLSEPERVVSAVRDALAAIAAS
ncbi:alpha/beta fold hydrolase [Chromobacterium haemolyticum]|uniref:alpha/beta fold hydrolase n=1 Tax=Chromobacterium TaxID=535 RepID=UPI001887720B|nr:MULTISPECIES: alpha/beta hydrolase [Chromobacterium]QOZ83591.1 alpha/beta hydrolase [Chromobacterium sp. Rain0013]WON83708.1 alpha/beta hydrolase [Chromobacterium haemolyticum]